MDPIALQPLIDQDRPRKRPAVIAHRGANREAPENTLPAIARAIALGAQGIEFDCLLTLDKVPIITHNDDLSRLTHHRGYAHATPFATIRSLDVGSHFSAQAAGTTMPTLAEALETIQLHDLATIVEIKPQPGMAASAAELIGGIAGDFRMRGPLVISSSSLRILAELRRRHPRIPRALIVRRKAFSFVASVLFARLDRFSGIHASMSAVTPALVERARHQGHQLFAWTANTPEDIDRCLALGVDGIITDDVSRALAQVSSSFGRAEG